MITTVKNVLVFAILFYIISALGVWFNKSDLYLRIYAVIVKILFFLFSYVFLTFAKEKTDWLLTVLAKIFFYNSAVRLGFEVLFLGCLVSAWYYTIVFTLTNGILYYYLIHKPKNESRI